MRSSTVVSREMAYSDDSSLTYGQVKAAATGDILLLEHANVTLSADAFSRLQASFERARDRDRQEAQRFYKDVLYAETALKGYQWIEQQRNAYTHDHPFMTVDRLLIEKKEARREAIAHEVLQGTKKKAFFHKLGYWQGIPLFLKSNFLSEVQYSLAIADPSTGGFNLPFQPSWLDEKNHWHIGASIEEFFQSLSWRMEAEQERITKSRQKAEEFEAQAETLFPQLEAWQTVLARKHALDHYIDSAASATTDEDLKKLTEMRQHLLETAPKEMMERPRPKNTAQVVRPPRNPHAEAQEEAISTQQIEVEQTEAKEQTIEEMVRTIQQSRVVGTKAVVSFGDLESIQKVSKGKKRKSTTAASQSQPTTDLIEKTRTKRGSASAQPQPEGGSTKKEAMQLQNAPLWNLMTQELASVRIASATLNSEPPEQLTLF
jgi:hypothetical protein